MSDDAFGALLPPVKALRCGSQVVHAAELAEEDSPSGPVRRLKLISVCGVRGSGIGDGEVNCQRCLKFIAGREGVTARFWSHVDKTGECWLWTFHKNRAGYGTFWDGERKVLAHRWSFSQAEGEIPEGLVLDHLCRTPACIRPSHLRAVTHRENVVLAPGSLAPSAMYAARTHCSWGHELAGANLKMRDGYRVCRACVSGKARASRQRNSRGLEMTEEEIRAYADAKFREYTQDGEAA
jgi:hypothetical protein